MQSQTASGFQVCPSRAPAVLAQSRILSLAWVCLYLTSGES